MRLPSSTLRLLRAATLICCIAGLTFGEDAKDLSQLDLRDLADVAIVSAARHEQNRTDSPRSVSVISAEEIRRRNYRNIPEAVASITGVFLQQTNYGGGAPIIRGMVGNRILLMVNGVRLNNGTYRLGPNQYLNTVDINRVERIEVVRGAGSALYGSDAFGGVINVITRDAPDPRQGNEVLGSVKARFGSADRSGEGRAEVSAARGPVSLTAGFTEASYGDLMGGGDRGRQPFTGYGQTAADVSMKFSLGANKQMDVLLGRLKQRGVDRTDVLQSGADLRHVWTAQGRDFIQAHYTHTPALRYLSALEISVGFQRPFEDIRRIAATEPAVERFHQDSVRSYNAGLQLSSTLFQRHILTYGLESAIDDVSSRRTDTNLVTGALRERTGTYPDNSAFRSVSIFVQDEISLSRRLGAVVGLRHDRIAVRSTVQDALIGTLDVDASPSASTASGHLLFKLSKNTSIFGGVAQGFRAPNIDDSSIIGGSARFEIPNSNLDPERSLNYEYGFRAHGKRASASITGFNSFYQDLIDRAPGRLAGLTFLDVDGDGVKDRQELDIWQRQNINRARVHGIELESMITLREGWTWTHSTTWTRGTDTSASQPLTRIPPLNGFSRLTWQARRFMWVEGAVVAAYSQRRLAPGDKVDARIGPAGTAGFAVFHLRAGLNGSVWEGLAIALENVTNKRYRLHGSGLDRPGTNLVISYARHF